MILVDNRRILVDRREYVAAAPSGNTVVVFQSDDSFEIVDIPLVARIEVKKERRRSVRMVGRC